MLGSVHLLRESDYPLPQAFDAAYAEAEALVMELDMDDLDPAILQQTMLAAGVNTGTATLRGQLGETAWAEASIAAQAIGIDLASLDFTEPWLAALTVVNLQMAKLGFNPAQGIEMHYVQRARLDGKPISGLETMHQQIAVFDEMPLPVQRRMLLKSFDDAQALESGMTVLIDAWRAGDTATLNRELLSSFEEFPRLYQTLVVARNTSWAAQIVDLLDDDDDYLVIVGALHLVGRESVIEILKEKGVRVSRN